MEMVRQRILVVRSCELVLLHGSVRAWCLFASLDGIVELIQAVAPRVLVEAGQMPGQHLDQGVLHGLEVVVRDLPLDVLGLEVGELGLQGGGVVQETNAHVDAGGDTDGADDGIGGTSPSDPNPEDDLWPGVDF